MSEREHARFELTIDSEDPTHLRPQVEHALREEGVRYELWGLSQNRLRYEVALPLDRKETLRKIIKVNRWRADCTMVSL